jgi:hypothetical protein
LFVFSVVCTIDLNRIVRQVNEPAGALQSKLFRTRSKVSLFVKPKLIFSPQSPNSDIEFSSIVQKRLYVFLNDQSFFFLLFFRFFLLLLVRKYSFFDLFYQVLNRLNNFNAMTSVSVFARFYKPRTFGNLSLNIKK